MPAIWAISYVKPEPLVESSVAESLPITRLDAPSEKVELDKAMADGAAFAASPSTLFGSVKPIDPLPGFSVSARPAASVCSLSTPISPKVLILLWSSRFVFERLATSVFTFLTAVVTSEAMRLRAAVSMPLSDAEADVKAV